MKYTLIRVSIIIISGESAFTDLMEIVLGILAAKKVKECHKTVDIQQVDLKKTAKLHKFKNT